jgi:hypothetical protein
MRHLVSRLIARSVSALAATQEIGEIRKTLNTEIEVLRNDFQDLRSNLKQQLEIAAGLAAQVCLRLAIARCPALNLVVLSAGCRA